MSVTTTVATWCCTCGTHIKVVGERDRKAKNAIAVACPRCGIRQKIYADRILTVSCSPRHLDDRTYSTGKFGS
jgi:hypothetical protein